MRGTFLLDLGAPISFGRVRILDSLWEKACVYTSVLGMEVGKTEGRPFWPHNVFPSAIID